MKGRVVACKEYGKPFEIEEFDVPGPQPGAVMLRMTQAGICGSDLHVWRGDQVNVPLPPTGRVMGHEGTGVVEWLGEGVSTDSVGTPIEEGDRIVYVHFRDVQGQVPAFNECFIDEGNVDTLAVVRALAEVGFGGFLITDHVPQIVDDTEWGHRGRAYAIGYIRALIDVVTGTA